MKYRYHMLSLLLGMLTLTGCSRQDGEEKPTPAMLQQDSIDREEESDARDVAVRKARSWAPWDLTLERADTFFASETHMIELFGKSSVTRGTIRIGEGEVVPATILFDDHPEMRIKVSWHDRTARRHPEQVLIEDRPSLWFLKPGLRTGIEIDSLGRLNGRSFEMSGFDRDYGGTILNWRGGRVEAMETGNAWLVVRTEATDSARARVSKEELREIIGDRLLNSDNEVVRTVNPVVSTILLVFSPPAPDSEKQTDSSSSQTN